MLFTTFISRGLPFVDISASIEKCFAFADSDDCELGEAVNPIPVELPLVANDLEDNAGIAEDVVSELSFNKQLWFWWTSKTLWLLAKLSIIWQIVFWM